MAKQYKVLLITFLMFYVFFNGIVYGEEKTWSAAGDGKNWMDDENWFPSNAPTPSDNVFIDTKDASIVCTETFRAKSITIGGRENPSLISENFILGTIAPGSSSDIAILNRSGATITLKGAGELTLKGIYKDSEGELSEEPSFMFWIK